MHAVKRCSIRSITYRQSGGSCESKGIKFILFPKCSFGFSLSAEHATWGSCRSQFGLASCFPQLPHWNRDNKKPTSLLLLNSDEEIKAEEKRDTAEVLEKALNLLNAAYPFLGSRSEHKTTRSALDWV